MEIDFSKLNRLTSIPEPPKETIKSPPITSTERPRLFEAIPTPSLEAILGEALAGAVEDQTGKRPDPPPANPGDPPGPTWEREINYRIWERAAIYQFDGGLTREEGEKRAIEELGRPPEDREAQNGTEIKTA